MSQIAKLKKLRETYSRLVIAKDAGVGITVIDSALKTGEIKNETLAKWLGSNRENALEKLKEEITGKRGRGGGRGSSKAAASKKAPAKKKASSAKKAAAPKKPRAAKKAKDDAAASSEAATA